MFRRQRALLTKLAALRLAGSGPIPEGVVVPVDPVGAINAGNYLKVPVLAGNTRDEAKLFPTFLALSPALGGVSGRLVSDATLFTGTTAVSEHCMAVALPARNPGTPPASAQVVVKPSRVAAGLPGTTVAPAASGP